VHARFTVFVLSRIQPTERDFLVMRIAMAGGKSDELEAEDGFEGNGDADSDEVAKTNANAVKNSLIKRRVIDDLLEERRLQRKLRDYDYDLDDDN
jgi:hypothetical protein